MGTDGAYTLYVGDGAWEVAASRSGYTAFPPRWPISAPPNAANMDFWLVLGDELRLRYLPLLMRDR